MLSQAAYIQTQLWATIFLNENMNKKPQFLLQDSARFFRVPAE